MGSVALNESPYFKQEGVNDYLRDKQAGKTEGITIYQNPWAHKTGHTSGMYNCIQQKPGRKGYLQPFTLKCKRYLLV